MRSVFHVSSRSRVELKLGERGDMSGLTSAEERADVLVRSGAVRHQTAPQQ